MTFQFASLESLRTRRSSKWRTYDADVLPAWVAELDVVLAEPIARALHDAVDRSDTGYLWVGALPESLAAFAEQRWGWRVDPAHVTVLPDVVSGLAHAIELFTRPADGVVITSPVYPPFWSTISRITARTVVDVPMCRDADGAYALDLDGLDEAFARPDVSAFVLCSPHNPSGTVPTATELRHIADSALRHNVAVIADEIHAPLTHPGVTHTPFLSVAPDELSAVSLVSASKGWNLAGLKCAQLVAGSDAVAAQVKDGIPMEVQFETGHFGVLASIAAYDEGGPWLDELIGHLAANAEYLGSALAAQLPGITYVPPTASYLAWLDCSGLDLDGVPSRVFLDQGRVALNPGRPFGPGLDAFVRLNFGTSRENLDEILARMRRALENASP